MTHPLKCENCGEYRLIKYENIRFAEDKKKGIDIEMPIYFCEKCNAKESVLPLEKYDAFSKEMFKELNEGEFFSISLHCVFSKLKLESTFEHFDHLGFVYDLRDYYIIPGLYRHDDDGFLTPVFFETDLLLYYNNHPDYSVRFTSFSSCNIYYQNKPMFRWGFGVNRNGKLFKWLGDLNDDLEGSTMISHLKRFQASNIPSDHEILSKFYLSQNPFSPEDTFQESDNEVRLFKLFNDFSFFINEQFGFQIIRVNINELMEYYRPPIMEERDQIFNSYLKLNKYLIENLQRDLLKRSLLEVGLGENEIERFGSLKLFTLFAKHILRIDDADSLLSPLFVLSDLRQLHGHLSITSFDDKYNSCKRRLSLPESASDLEVFKQLITSLIQVFTRLNHL